MIEVGARWAPFVALLLWSVAAVGIDAQVVSGRITDAVTEDGVGLTAVIVLGADREPLGMHAAGVDGVYRIELASGGEYYLVFERLGYFENETPLLAIGDDGEFGVDVEMRPEPFRLDPLDVTVRNEELEDFLTLEFGQHPATIPGYRSIQGVRLEEAKLRAKDNTDLLRWLYVPVSHGQRVCVGTFGAPLPERMSYERTNAAAEPADPEAQCGALYLDGLRCRNEHIEDIDMDRIGVVVTSRSSVHLYTRDFEWTFRPGRGGGGC